MTDLSGAWLGTYWQQGQPVRFEMTLVQGGNTISGNILDNNYLGEASLAGTVTGRSVSFTKKYLMGSRHSVEYSGTVSEDENTIRGKWQLPIFSGAWEAQRQDDNLSLEQTIKGVEKIPVGIA
ncbi:MAG: hypothetical protein QNJ70_05390 [Xenococcaceae cyanobacterium MO_207.B15]|nr:hypothetical protein [Xenococcaceae cyanobacterium MO_207.B15]MDJ0746215.1 hypothetical protein [Xenococcaceae cyanobacterium MO_167.B27]